MPTTLIYKLAGGLIAALALFLLVQDRNHWKKVAGERNAELTQILEVTREAADNPGLARSGVVKQIRELGTSLEATTGALDRQTAALNGIAAQQKRDRETAAKALKRAEERARTAGATRARLEASARAPERLSAPCELSPALKDAWR